MIFWTRYIYIDLQTLTNIEICDDEKICQKPTCISASTKTRINYPMFLVGIFKKFYVFVHFLRKNGFLFEKTKYFLKKRNIFT
jgi:hypothetical protein